MLIFVVNLCFEAFQKVIQDLKFIIQNSLTSISNFVSLEKFIFDYEKDNNRSIGFCRDFCTQFL